MVEVRPIPPDVAAERLRGLESLDPRGLCTAEDIAPMCRACECYEVTQGEGSAVVVLTRANGVAWIEAAAGQGGADLTQAIDDAMRHIGAGAVAFQTKRRGLVARCEKLGYRVAGYIMRRDA